MNFNYFSLPGRSCSWTTGPRNSLALWESPSETTHRLSKNTHEVIARYLRLLFYNRAVVVVPRCFSPLYFSLPVTGGHYARAYIVHLLLRYNVTRTCTHVVRTDTRARALIIFGRYPTPGARRVARSCNYYYLYIILLRFRPRRTAAVARARVCTRIIREYI